MTDFKLTAVHRFSFFSLIQHLLDKGVLNSSLTEFKGSPFKILPARHRSFPAADIEQFEKTAKGWILRCNFHGLYGVDSPLPMYLNQQALQGNSKPFQDFLDLLHQQSYSLYFKSWQAFMPEHSIRFDACCHALGRQEPSPKEMGASPVEKLLAFIQQLLPEVNIKSCRSSSGWQPLRKAARFDINEALILGDNSYLGTSVYDSAKFIDIEIGSLSWQQARKIQPGQIIYQQLKQYITQHFEPFYTFRLGLDICPKPADLCLGVDAIVLGMNKILMSMN